MTGSDQRILLFYLANSIVFGLNLGLQPELEGRVRRASKLFAPVRNTYSTWKPLLPFIVVTQLESSAQANADD
jgi:hypothetical protein